MDGAYQFQRKLGQVSVVETRRHQGMARTCKAACDKDMLECFEKRRRVYLTEETPDGLLNLI